MSYRVKIGRVIVYMDDVDDVEALVDRWGRRIELPPTLPDGTGDKCSTKVPPLCLLSEIGCRRER